MRQREQVKLVLDVRGLGRLRAQELPARGQVVKQRARLDARARRVAAVAHRFDLAAVDEDFRPRQRPGSRVASRKRDTLAMLGSASPRNPSVAIAARSAPVRILLVAWRSRQSSASSRSMPCPSSTTRTSAMPPRCTATSTDRAFASRLFSTSSLTTDAGRSTTSPAATWLATTSDNRATRLMETHPTSPAPATGNLLELRGGWVMKRHRHDYRHGQRRQTSPLPARRTRRAAGAGLRIFVENGGCSGMQYGMSFDQPKADDEMSERDGVRVLVDAASAAFLRGSVVDYEDSLTGTGFRIQNPNARRTCGCGTSFRTRPPAAGRTAAH